MITYITFDIETLEDIKMGSTRSSFDMEYALNYISGSAIRGGFVRAYINKYNGINISEDKNSREKLLCGKMKFLNAYPVLDGVRSIPFPKGLYAKKDDIKKFHFFS